MYTKNERIAICKLLLEFLEYTNEYPREDNTFLKQLVKRVQQYGTHTLREPQDRAAWNHLIHVAAS